MKKFCTDKIAIETDTPNPERVAVITKDGIVTADGYRVRMIEESVKRPVLPDEL